MKICVINSLFKPYRQGGAETVVKNVVFGLIDKGYQVVVITLGKKKKIEQDGQLKIYRIKPLNIFSFIDIEYYPTWLRAMWHFFDVFNFSGYFQVKKILLAEKPDLVMTHNLKGISYLLPELTKKFKIRHIHTIHDVQLVRPSGLIIYKKEKPFLILDKIYEKMCLNLFTSPDIIISPSRWLLDYYRIRGFFHDSKKIILPNPIINLSKPDFSEKDTNNFVKFIYVGQLEESKGILFLIKVLKKVSQRRWELKIIGRGRSEKQIAELIKGDSNFKLYGYVPNSELDDFYKESDFTLVPSLCYENSPAVIYESFANGVPVLASDIGGISELVKDNYNGFTFEPGDESSLIKVIEHFLRYKNNYFPKFKKNAFETVKDFGIENYITKLEDFIDYLK